MVKDLKNINTFIFDLDGTLYLDGVLFEGVKNTLQTIRNKGKRVLFITNNSSVSNLTYFNKLQQLGLTDNAGELVTSQDVVIDYLKKKKLTDSVYLLGTKDLQAQFLQNGFNLQENAKVVVVAFDKELTYLKLKNCCDALRHGAFYVITHSDINCPTQSGFEPDVGSFIKLIEASTGRVPELTGGKPTTLLSDYINDKFGLSTSEVAFVGDRLYTDIKFALSNNYLAVLVLTGETKKNDLKKEKLLLPNLVLNSVNDIVDLI